MAPQTNHRHPAGHPYVLRFTFYVFASPTTVLQGRLIMATRIVFGTDGWRAVIADEYTFDNVRRCARGVAELITSKGLAERGVVVGYDMRFESEDFAAAAAETLAAAGVRVHLCARSEPTPVISHAILDRKAGGGVTITAS